MIDNEDKLDDYKYWLNQICVKDDQYAINVQ